MLKDHGEDELFCKNSICEGWGVISMHDTTPVYQQQAWTMPVDLSVWADGRPAALQQTSSEQATLSQHV